MNQVRRTLTPEKALARLEDLCARSEQATGEAAKKLAAWGISATDARRIIDSLVSRRYIDDRRYCQAFVKDKFRFARWGKRKIYAALSLKRIDRSLIGEALDGIDDDEYLSVLEELIRIKARTISGADTYDGRTRLFRFAASRGFEPELISRVLRSMAARG